MLPPPGDNSYRSLAVQMLTIAWPVFIEQFLTMFVGLSDTLIANRYLEDVHGAAITLVTYFLWLLTAFFTAIDIGALALVARAIGARDPTLSRRTVNQAFLLGLIISIPIAVCGYAFAPYFVGVMRLEPVPAALAVSYLRIVIPVMPLTMCQFVGAACLRGAGDTAPGMVIMLIVNAINIVMSWGLVLGVGPLPRLGWEGIAVGTMLGFAFGGVLMCALLIRGRRGLKLSLDVFTPDFPLMRRLLRVGAPGGLDVFTIIACQFWFLSIVNTLGTIASAAHGVGIKLESLAYLPGTAFQVAASAMAGQSLGAEDHQRASRSVLTALVGGISVMSIAGFVLFFGAEPLSVAFISADKVETIDLTTRALRVIAWAMPLLAFWMVLTGALRGAGDTRWGLLFSLTGFLGVRIPLAYFVVNYLEKGLVGLWYVMVTDIAVRSCLVSARFFHGGWKRTVV